MKSRGAFFREYRPGNLLITAIKCIVLIAVVFCAFSAHSEGISVTEYRRQLSDLSVQVAQLGSNPELAAKVETALPEKLNVHTDEGVVSVDYRALKHDLAEYGAADEKRRTALFAQIRSYVAALNTAAEAFARSPSNASAIRTRLAGILARREFHRVHGPSFLDLALSKIFGWLSRVLGRFFLRGASGTTALHLVIYCLIGGAIVVVAAWTFRRMRSREDDSQQREIIPFAPSARGWRTWLGDARSLAAKQDWRNAIHMAYWAGISFLEEHGAWRPNRSRTPREYLRLVNPRTAQHAPLSALTRKFEFVWYGAHEAMESDFQETLRQLETLGCR